MNNYSKNEKGITTIEVVIYLAVLSLLSAIGVSVQVELRRTKLVGSIEQAKMIANYANVYRSRIATEYSGVNGELLRTYDSLATGTSVSVLNAALSTSLPIQSQFQTNYTVFAQPGKAAEVSFTVPYVTSPSQTISSVSSGITTITVLADPTVPRSGLRRAQFMKQVFFMETSP